MGRNRSTTPLIFMSHDSRDKALAKHFAELVRDLSNNKIRCFVSSEHEGNGIQYGEDWYRTITRRMNEASMLLALLTPKSLDRPWILFETGFVRGRGKPVAGVAIGVSLEQVNHGPFLQSQNAELEVESLTDLMSRILKLLPSGRPRANVIRARVESFLGQITTIVSELVHDREVAQREARDWQIVRDMQVELREVTHSLGNLLASGRLHNLSGPKRAQELAGTVLLRATACLKRLCPDAVCCLKIADSPEYLRCYFPPEVVSGESPNFEKIETQNSYSGLALQHGRIYFVPSWRDAREFVYHGETKAILEKRGIYGLVVYPVKIRATASETLAPVAVFKVDFHSPGGLVDNAPTRMVLDTVVDVLALAFQEALGADRSITSSQSKPRKRS